MTPSLRLPALLLLALFLNGCGQSGPLYVSGNPSTIQTDPEQASTEDEDDEKAEATDSE